MLQQLNRGRNGGGYVMLLTNQISNWTLSLRTCFLSLQPTWKKRPKVFSELESAPKSDLPRIVSYNIDYWKAKFLMESYRLEEAKNSLKRRRASLKKVSSAKSSAAKASAFLALLRNVMSKLESSRRESEILKHSLVDKRRMDHDYN